MTDFFFVVSIWCDLWCSSGHGARGDESQEPRQGPVNVIMYVSLTPPTQIHFSSSKSFLRQFQVLWADQQGKKINAGQRYFVSFLLANWHGIVSMASCYHWINLTWFYVGHGRKYLRRCFWLCAWLEAYPLGLFSSSSLSSLMKFLGFKLCIREFDWQLMQQGDGRICAPGQ